jgi:gliding motility-associated-like protein
MKFIKTILFFAIICCTTSIVFAQNITVYDTKTAYDLVGILTNNSPCVSVSSETVIGDNFTINKYSYGSFNNVGGNFPFSEGILLNTWSATNAIGPYVAGDVGGGSFFWSGDTDLNQTLSINSKNATSLEFDFIPLTNFISFNYIFASNEYQYDFPCNYSDGFAFLIKEENDTTYNNLAVIPGTSTPVSSLNIHPKIPLGIKVGPIFECDASYEEYFSRTPESPINYAGQTVTMNAQTKVIPNKKYHIKLVIADDKSFDYDSAVFLEAGSFAPKIDLGADRLLSTNPVCFGEPFVLNTNFPATSFKWYKDGVPIPLKTDSFLEVTIKGTYKVEATLPSGCIATGEIKIEYAPEIILNNTPLDKCDDTGNGTATFDLTKTKTDLLIDNPATTTIKYFETKTGTTLSGEITDPSSFKKIGLPDKTVYAQLTSIYECEAIAEIKLHTNPSVLNNTLITPQPIINYFLGGGNSATLVPPTTSGPYMFSLDGSNYQASPLFTNLTAGNHTAYIRNSDCDYSSNTFAILDYPHFFTPNEDGKNDEWEIKSYPNALISIFDRYGKLLKQFPSIGGSWNGTFNGFKLPADDYWFTIHLENGEIIKGHFSLIR